ncbi:MAG: heavy-metal-associated domain-containing protein [Methanohalobium sp.]|uniref:heavy-metal-associated domain-containing protein n=1 Tax=Methanohalobium sp. TaxID=2837493 RepID=UPI00397C5973
MEEVTIKIEGMSCAHCQANVKKAITSVNSVSSAEVNLEEGKATVQYDPTKTELDKIKSAVEDMGYEAKV